MMMHLCNISPNATAVCITFVPLPCLVFQVGAKVDLSPFESKITPLMLALALRSPNSLIQSLLQSGADPHLVDAAGATVLHLAARERNAWAIKWLIAENVDLEAPTPVGVDSVPKTAFHYLLDNCGRTFKLNDAGWGRCLEFLRSMQILALAGAQLIANSTNNKMTQKELIGYLNWFVSRSKGLSNIPCNGSDELQTISREIRDIVHVLTDILRHPLPLTHICRNQIRRLLGRDFHRKLHHLHVPIRLQDYLMVYRESDILMWVSMWNICKMNLNPERVHRLLLKCDRFCLNIRHLKDWSFHLWIFLANFLMVKMTFSYEKCNHEWYGPLTNQEHNLGDVSVWASFTFMD